MGPVYAGTNRPYTGGATYTAPPSFTAQQQQNQQLTQQRQAAVAAQQKAEKRVGELEEELQGFRDIAEGKGDVGFKTPLRTVSTAGSMGGNLRIGNGGATSRRAVRARARGVSQLSTG